MASPPPASLSYLIISGGTGANSIASAFGPSPAFVLPVSDDGGSSAEILRCFGGPSIGDIRSRLSRLIPTKEDVETRDEKERMAIYNLMAYRFPSDAPERVVRDLWMEIVEGRSGLWDGIGQDKKECIRAFLVHFQTLCLRRAHKRFSFRNFSLGNGFLTGARDLFGSLPSAIFLFKSIAGVDPGVQVIPVINTNQTVTIAASLVNGSTIIGQCAISHPVEIAGSSPASNIGVPTPAHTPAFTPPPPTPFPFPFQPQAPEAFARKQAQANHTGSSSSTPSLRTHFRRDSRTFDLDIQSPSEPASRSSLDGSPRIVVEEPEEKVGGNIGYRKGEEEIPLEARIERIFYINLYGQEIYPEPNPEFLDALVQRDILVYSCGSLYTSIIPCLALRGLASAIAISPTLRAKVILLNSKNDRETPGYRASDYVQAILDTLGRFGRRNQPNQWKCTNLVSHMVHLEGGLVELDRENLDRLGITLVCVPAEVHGPREGRTPMFTPGAVEWAMARVMEDLQDAGVPAGANGV
ncbi:hypothetical protein JCM24511_02921 [Saitozyma sp. JCM 24511]|nr:hypothetical protein JCM24511_02921 [Saitozyma sp. JCM 24511]